MSLGLLVSSFFAFITVSILPLRYLMFNTNLGFVIVLSPLVIGLFMSYRKNQISLSLTKFLFFLYSVLIGMSLSWVFLLYTYSSVANTFLICGVLFALMSIYGYATNKELTSLGSFLLMGLIGVFIAIFANVFIKSSALNTTISILGVIIFTGLIAYDTQKIKSDYHSISEKSDSEKFAIFSALYLYLNIVNLFTFLIQLVGTRRR